MMEKHFWLETTSGHFHLGHAAEVKILWGFNMVPSGGFPPETSLEAWIVTEDGKDERVEVKEKRDAQGRMISFLPQNEGAYQLVAAVRIGGTEYFSRVVVEVGHEMEAAPIPAGLPLELIPERTGPYGFGDIVKMTVLRNGRPLSGATVAATYHLHRGDHYPFEFVSDENGMVEIPLNHKGHWLFVTSIEGEKRVWFSYTIMRVI